MDNNQNNQQLQIEIKPEVAQGVYSNLVAITHSSSEVIFDFINMMPGMPKASVGSRIVMAPEHAKRLLRAIKDNIRKYEKQFGEIKLRQAQQPRPGSTIAPFELNTKGEA